MGGVKCKRARVYWSIEEKGATSNDGDLGDQQEKWEALVSDRRGDFDGEDGEDWRIAIVASEIANSNGLDTPLTRLLCIYIYIYFTLD